MDRRRNRRGIALVWTALVLIVMVGMVGLSIDWGKVTWNVHQMQNAADAAALAGAQVVKQAPTGDTLIQARDFALKNSADRLPVTLRTTQQADPFNNADADSLDIILGRWVTYNRTFVPTLDAPNAVKTIARRTGQTDDSPPLAMVFGPIFGTNTVSATRSAIAACFDSSGSGLICLSDTRVPGLIIGSGILDVDGGGIHVNSYAASSNPSGKFDGAQVTGSALIDSGFINVVGEITPGPDDPDWAGYSMGAGITVMDGTSTPVPQHIADPLASAMQAVAQPYVLYKVPPAAPYAAYLDLPTLLTLIPTYSIPTVTASATLAPGYYPNGVSINNGVTVTLAPTSSSGLGTLFVFGGAEVGSDKLGPGLTVNGGALIGHGVTCYVTENVTAPDGGLGVTDWGAGSAIDLWSPGDWQNHINGTEDLSLVEGLNGVAVWQDPNMRYQNEAVEVHLNGTPGGGVHGTLYFPDPIHVFLNGDLGQMGNQILCGSATVEGNATISVDFDGRNAGVSSNASNLVR